jgi:5-methylthioribose kinase
MPAAALNIEVKEMLREYLRQRGLSVTPDAPVIDVLGGGVSNRTVRIEWPSGEAWVMKQALEKLRVEVDWTSDPKRIHREALGLRRLWELVPSGMVTPLVFEDHEHHLLAMQAVPQPHQNWKSALMEGRIETGHFEQFGTLLGTIHREAHERRSELAEEFDDYSFFETLRLEPFYAYTATQVRVAGRSTLEYLNPEERVRQRDAVLKLMHHPPSNVSRLIEGFLACL